MHKFITVMAASAVMVSSAVFAQSATDKGLESAPAAQITMQSSQTVSTETQDGNKVEISPTGMVSVFNKYGDKTAAPDGTLTLKDGTSLTIKDGKKV